MLSVAITMSLLASESSFWASAWKESADLSIQDAYKWIYHAANGGEHAITHLQAVTNWMDREWEGLDLNALPSELVFIPLDPWGRVIRVNLRPAKRQNLPKESIFAWFLGSARELDRSLLGFQVRWRVLGLSLSKRKSSYAFTREDWIKFDLETSSRGYPAVHHSPAYESSNLPAYRVGLARLWRHSHL